MKQILFIVFLVATSYVDGFCTPENQENRICNIVAPENVNKIHNKSFVENLQVRCKSDIDGYQPNFSEESFTQFIRLQYLNMSRCHQKSLYKRMFANLRYLVGLDLSYNNLKTLENDLFKNMHYLEYLFVSHNNITTVGNIFKDNPILKLWNLEYNQISNLSFVENYCKYLVEINLSHNNISDITIINNCRFLTRVDLSYNKIEELKPNLFKNANLKFLNLSHNNIQLIHSNAFESADRLEILDLNYNKLTSINDINLPNLKLLHYLNVVGNHIDLDDDFENNISKSSLTEFYADNFAWICGTVYSNSLTISSEVTNLTNAFGDSCYSTKFISSHWLLSPNVLYSIVIVAMIILTFLIIVIAFHIRRKKKYTYHLT